MPISISDPRVKRAAGVLRSMNINPYVSSNAEAIAAIVLASGTEDTLDEHAAHNAAILAENYIDSRPEINPEPPEKPTDTYLRVLPPDENIEHYTVTGNVTQLLNDKVTDAGRTALIEKHGTDSGNYMAQKVLGAQQAKGLWEGVRLDSEHGQFFAYAKDEQQAKDLVDFLVGLSWTTT